MKKAVAGFGLADDYVMEVLICQHKLVSYIVNCALFEDVSVSANDAVPDHSSCPRLIITSASASASTSASASASALGSPRPRSLLCLLQVTA